MNKSVKIKYSKKQNLFHVEIMGIKYTMSYIQLSHLKSKIADELFVYNPKHFLKICDLIIERKYDFNIWCYSRVDTCKPEYLDRMKKGIIDEIHSLIGINTVLEEDIEEAANRILSLVKTKICKIINKTSSGKNVIEYFRSNGYKIESYRVLEMVNSHNNDLKTMIKLIDKDNIL